MTRVVALLAIAALIVSALFTYALVRAGASPSPVEDPEPLFV